MDAAAPADAIRAALSGAVAATTGGRTAYYSFAADTAGTAAADHRPYLVTVAGNRGVVRLEDLARRPGVADWDYDDRTWRVDVRPSSDPAPAGSGGGFAPLSGGSGTLVGEWTYDWVSPFGETATITTTVTFDKLGYEGLYFWNYHVHNNDFGTIAGSGDALADVYVSVDEPGVITNVMNEDGTSGDVIVSPEGWAQVHWQAPTADGLAPSEDGDMWFTTPPRPVVATVGEMWDTTTAMTGGGDTKAPGPLPQVVITDGGAVEIPAATGLKVAKWGDAFELDAASQAAIKGPDPGTNYDFIDRDGDRFNVWVYNPAKWNEMKNGAPANPRIDVNISTTNVAGFTAYNDDATAVDAVRYTGLAPGKESGWYWSDSQLLVSNAVDDGTITGTADYLQTDDTGPGDLALPKNGTQWKKSDRTHRVALGGTVKAEYTFGPGGTVASDKPVLVKKNVKVHVTLLRLTAGGSQVISQTEADGLIRQANEQYAQVGIRLVPTFQAVDPPAGVDLSNGFDGTTGATDGVNNLTDEEKALVGAATIRTAATDDVELYFVNRFSNGVQRGQSYGASYMPDPKYADSAVISVERHTPFTVAHEIGHLLLDDGKHYTAALWPVNLMQTGTSTTDAVEASKRLTPDQETDMVGPPGKRPNLLTNPG